MSSIDKQFGHMLPTTVVGSYPTKNVKEALIDQIKAGVEYISTGQVCMYGKNMTQPFFEAMGGVKVISLLEKEVPILEKISPKKDISDTHIIDEINQAQKVLSEFRNNKEGIEVSIKGIITGPSTIMWDIPPFGLGSYQSHEDLLDDLSEVLVVVAKEMIKRGTSFIQIDEPIFSRHPELANSGAKAISTICEKINAKVVALHVCGELNRSLFEKLASISGVDILDHEFSEFQSNFDVIEREILVKMDKNVGLGVINRSRQYIESIESVKRLIKRGISEYGADRIIIDPDCGLRTLPREVAKEKLRVMVQATREIRKESGFM